jgi:hypothetical protein
MIELSIFRFWVFNVMAVLAHFLKLKLILRKNSGEGRGFKKIMNH